VDELLVDELAETPNKFLPEETHGAENQANTEKLCNGVRRPCPVINQPAHEEVPHEHAENRFGGSPAGELVFQDAVRDEPHR